jgi:hypothetical protein
MQKRYEAPKLTLIGQTDEVVLGYPGSGLEGVEKFTPDFEFEQD